MQRVRRRRLLLMVLVPVLALLADASAADAAGSRLVGTVYERSGAPGVSMLVEVARGADRWRFVTGDDGQYYLGNLPDGAYQVTVAHQGKQLYSGAVSLPREQPFDIRLE